MVCPAGRNRRSNSTCSPDGQPAIPHALGGEPRAPSRAPSTSSTSEPRSGSDAVLGNRQACPPPTSSSVRNVIIIGSGPAGHTAAIYAARANLKPLMFEGLARGGIPGGQLMITNDVENYPGFPEKIDGPGAHEELPRAVDRAGRRDHHRRRREGRPSQAPLHRVGGRRQAGAPRRKTVIIATGAQAKWLGLQSEAALQGKGVSACAVCDGAFFRNQDVIVVGGGDTAMEESMYLSGPLQDGHAHPPARGVPREQDDAGARAREPEDQADLRLGHRGDPRRLAGSRSRARA